MSLVQRVTPLEGFDRELPHGADDNDNDDASHLGLSRAASIATMTTMPTTTMATISTPQAKQPAPLLSFLHSDYGTPRSLRHVISFDALPRPGRDESRATHPTGGVAAYKVSTGRRLAQVVATTLACWLSSGIVFGFAALKPVLIAQGVYRDLCLAEELAAGVEVCYQQDLRLNFFFAVASTTCNISALPAGTLLDRHGPRVTTSVGSIFLAIGSLLMARAFAVPEFDGYIAGNGFLALGGTFIFVPSFQIANAFPRYAGSIIALVTGAFDASAAVFLFSRLAYQASNRTFTPEKFFYAYLVVPVLILLVQVLLMNPDGYKTVPQLEEKIGMNQDVTQDVHDSDDDLSERDVRKLRAQRRDRRESVLAELDSLLGDATARQAQIEKREEVQATSGVWGALHGKSAHKQMQSPWFVLMTLLTVLQMLRMNFFIATVRGQYEYMLGSRALAEAMNSFFDVALPIGGIAATPFIGALLDNVSTAVILSILVALITAVGILGSLPFVAAGYANIVLFVLLRPLYYTAMSDYAAKVFGFATFGRVYGAIICFSGLGFVIGASLVAFVWVKGRRVHRGELKKFDMTERHPLMPELTEEDESDYGTMT